MARALPSGVIEVDSSNIAVSSATYRMFFGAVPYSYLTDFATWNIASKGTANLAPNSGLTLKAHNSTFGNVIGPALTLGEIDGCRIYDIDRTMRGTVSNGSIIGSTSTSYLGFVNNQFRIFSGSGDLASAYKLGQEVGATRYKMDSVSHTTLSFNRNSSGVLTARTLNYGGGVSFDFLDDARSISVADPATNYTRSASTVDASLEGIDNALALKASIVSVSTETSRAMAAESSLAQSVSTEKSRAEASESSLAASIVSEKNRAEASETSIASSIAQEVLDREQDVIDEQNRAQGVEGSLAQDILDEQIRAEGVESSLSLAISSEKNRAEGVESSLAQSILSVQNALDFVQQNTDPTAIDSLTEIVSAFQSMDGSLQASIELLASNASSAVGAEQSRAMAAESSLAQSIIDEKNRAEIAEMSLASSVSQEALDRAQNVIDEQVRAQGVEGSLAQSILDEQNRAQGIESSISSALAQEILDRVAGDSSEMSRAQLVEASLAQAITSETNRSTSAESSISSALAQEVMDRQQGDLNEQSRAVAAELGLQLQIEEEMANRTIDINLLIDADIAETSRAMVIEDSLQSQIDALSGTAAGSLGDEISRAMAAESLIQSNLDAAVLQTNIDLNSIHDLIQTNEETNGAVHEGLQTNIEAEMERAMGVEQGLEDSKVGRFGDMGMTGNFLITEPATGINTSIVGGYTSFFNPNGDSAVSSIDGMTVTNANGSLSQFQNGTIIMQDASEEVTASLDLSLFDMSSPFGQVQFGTGGAVSFVINDENGHLSWTNGQLQSRDSDSQPSMPNSQEDLTTAAYVDQQDTALSERIDAIEAQTDGPYFEKQKEVISDASSFSSVTLSNAPVANSVCVQLGRLMLIEGEDYSVSGSVVTLMGDVVFGGSESIENGDVIIVSYARSV
jgi:hypothetical protein